MRLMSEIGTFPSKSLANQSKRLKAGLKVVRDESSRDKGEKKISLSHRAGRRAKRSKFPRGILYRSRSTPLGRTRPSEERGRQTGKHAKGAPGLKPRLNLNFLHDRERQSESVALVGREFAMGKTKTLDDLETEVRAFDRSARVPCLPRPIPRSSLPFYAAA